MAFGKANYEKGFKKKNYFNLADGTQVFRILPPCGKLEKEGAWSRYYSVHFGYKNLAGKLRTFLSPEKTTGKGADRVVEIRDAALDRITELKAQYDIAKSANNQPLMARLAGLVGMKGVYNIDRNHHVNALELTTGKIGVLKMRHKCKTELDLEILRLKKEDNCDPLSSENGRCFNFTRTGTGNETNFKVTEYKVKKEVLVEGVTTKVDCTFVHKLTPEMENDCADLDNLFIAVTAEECKQIVDESDLLTGKSAACDRIFDARWKAARDQTTQAVAGEDDQPGDDYVAPTSQPKAAAPAATAPQGGASAPATAAVLTSNPPQTPAPATTYTAPAAQAAAAPTQAQVIDEMDDKDFFASIGVKTG